MRSTSSVPLVLVLVLLAVLAWVSVVTAVASTSSSGSGSTSEVAASGQAQPQPLSDVEAAAADNEFNSEMSEFLESESESESESEDESDSELEDELDSDESDESNGSEADADSNRETEPGMAYWGDEHTEVDSSDMNDEVSAEADTAAEGESESDTVMEVETLDAASESAHHISAPYLAAAAAAHRAATANGIADSTSFVENDQRIRHDVPLQASSWLAMLSDAKHYQSNVMKAAAKAGVKGGPCAGVISANCKHEADMQSSIADAPKWQEECGKLICNPLCLRYTWDVKIIASGGPEGFEDQVNSLGTQYSLGAQFRAHACGKIAGCCEENQDLLDWVELRSFAGMFPESPQPALACDLRANAVNGDSVPTIPTKDSLCDQCKAAISIEATPKADACDYFTKVPDPPEMGDEDEVFARNGKSAAAEIPKHKSFQEKCKAVQGLMAGIISGLASGDWKEKACNCLGCCESDPNDSCYYPVVYGTDDEAHAVHKS